MDPDPAIFVIDLQDASKKKCFNTIFSAYYFLKLHLHHFSKIKSQNESQNSRNQGFFSVFFHDDRRIRIRIREAQKHVDPDPDSDPDPHHCKKQRHLRHKGKK
jgi:hypothetical protein